MELIWQIPIPFVFRLKRPMTDRELLRFFAMNEMLWIERDNQGWLHVNRCGSWQVGCVSAEMGFILNQWTRDHGHGIAFANAGFLLPDSSILGPNLAWMPNEQWLSLTRKEQIGFAPRCPDFVIEILSPFMTLAALQLKMDLWIANGVKVAWLVNIDLKTVTIYRQGRQAEVLEQLGIVRGDGPVAGLEVNMSDAWASVQAISLGSGPSLRF